MRMLVATLAALRVLGAATGPDAAPAAVSVTVVNLEYEGTQIWLPGTIVVRQGAQVRLGLVNNVPPDGSQHGFTIPDYGIAEVVTRGEPGTV